MARDDHLPIDRAAFDRAVHIEMLVRHFSRDHTYTLGTERRDGSRRILARIIEAHDSRDRGPVLTRLRQELEWFTVLARLCQESGAFASTRAYLYVAEPIVGLAKQNEGWLRQTVRGRGRRADQDRSGEAGSGQNRAERAGGMLRHSMSSPWACSRWPRMASLPALMIQ